MNVFGRKQLRPTSHGRPDCAVNYPRSPCPRTQDSKRSQWASGRFFLCFYNRSRALCSCFFFLNYDPQWRPPHFQCGFWFLAHFYPLLIYRERGREPSKEHGWDTSGKFGLWYNCSKGDSSRMESLRPLWFLVPGTFLSLITVVGNGLVVYLIMTRRCLHNATNWIVLSLAIADFFIGMGYLPAAILLRGQWLVRYSIFSFLAAASALNLSLLTFDRYVFITRPLRYCTLLTTKRAVLLIVAVWLASFVPHLLVYLISLKNDSAGVPKAFEYFDFVVFEISPMVALSVFVGRIFVIVRRQERRVEIQMREVRFNRQVETGSEMSSHNRRTATMKFICGAVSVFVFCYLCETTVTLYPLITRFDPTKATTITFRRLLTLLYIVNSAINPVVYALFKSDIKRSLRRMVHRNRRYWPGPKREPRTGRWTITDEESKDNNNTDDDDDDDDDHDDDYDHDFSSFFPLFNMI